MQRALKRIQLAAAAATFAAAAMLPAKASATPMLDGCNEAQYCEAYYQVWWYCENTWGAPPNWNPPGMMACPAPGIIECTYDEETGNLYHTWNCAWEYIAYGCDIPAGC